MKNIILEPLATKSTRATHNDFVVMVVYVHNYWWQVNDENLSTHNGAHGGGTESLQHMDTCPTSSLEIKMMHAKDSFSKETYDKQKGGRECGKVEGLQVQTVGMVGKLGGVGGSWRLMSMCMNIHAYEVLHFMHM